MFKTRSLVQEIAYQLEQRQIQALARLTDVDPQTIIYADGGWRVQDIIAHLTVWEEEIACALRAYQNNGAYKIVDFELQAFNTAHYEQRKMLPWRQLCTDWLNIRKRLKWQVETMSLEKLGGIMTYPSGRQGECGVLVCEIISHQEEHFNDILAVTGR
jgi:hypothetical protein